MEVILLQNVENLGQLGERVKVKGGFGRNYLIPYGKAVPATNANLAAFEAKREALEREAALARTQAEQRKATLDGVVISVARRAGDEGKLFGSVGTADVAEACTAAGYPVEKHEVRLPEGAFRQTGEYQVVLHLHGEVNTTITLHVIAE